MIDTAAHITTLGDTGNTLLPFLETYGYWFVYVGTVLLGEIVIITSFLLSGQDIFSLPAVFLFSVLGTLTADLFWYVTGRFLFFRKAQTRFRAPKVLSLLVRFLDHVTKDHLFLPLLFSKFILGGRLVTILYLVWKRIAFIAFIVFDIIGVVLFVSTLALLGWTSGKGLAVFFADYHFLSTTAIALLALLFIIFLIKEVAAKKVLKKEAAYEEDVRNEPR